MLQEFRHFYHSTQLYIIYLLYKTTPLKSGEGQTILCPPPTLSEVGGAIPPPPRSVITVTSVMPTEVIFNSIRTLFQRQMSTDVYRLQSVNKLSLQRYNYAARYTNVSNYQMCSLDHSAVLTKAGMSGFLRKGQLHLVLTLCVAQRGPVGLRVGKIHMCFWEPS